MEQKDIHQKRANFQKLRSKVASDMNLGHHSQNSRTEISEKFSEDSIFSFQDYYRLSEKLGVEGVVRKCQEIQTSKNFAVKILWVNEQKIFSIKQNFITTRILKHPSIIQHHKLYINQKKEQAFLLMQYCPYPSLQSLYKTINNRFQIAHIMKSLLEAVCVIHKNGICHRDLKPQNILYDPISKNVKIIDLGISKLLSNRKTGEKSKMWSVTGTLHYKAPQMLQGFAYDEKIDAWSLGVIAYQLAYGRLPFSSQFQISLVQQILKQQPIFEDSSKDSLLISFIQGLLRKRPQRRMNCFQALHHPFIENRSLDVKSSRYDSLLNLDQFSYNISRPRSLDDSQARHTDPQQERKIKLQELKESLISNCDGEYL